MIITRILPFRAFLLITLISLFVCLSYGKDGPPVVRIVRNVAWNDLITRSISCQTMLRKIRSTTNCSLSKDFSRRTKPK
jgi:hypothetical protein